MRINIDRLCELAGVPGAKKTRGSKLMSEAYEGAGHDQEASEMAGMSDELMNALDEAESDDENEGMDHSYEGMGHAYEGEEAEKDKLDEMIEIDEVDLVNELRRARVLVRERKRAENQKKQSLQESQLKSIIDQEVKNVLKELQLTSGWVYGDRKPTKSRPGFTHQGSYLKGIGFK